MSKERITLSGLDYRPRITDEMYRYIRSFMIRASIALSVYLLQVLLAREDRLRYM